MIPGPGENTANCEVEYAQSIKCAKPMTTYKNYTYYKILNPPQIEELTRLAKATGVFDGARGGSSDLTAGSSSTSSGGSSVLKK